MIQPPWIKIRIYETLDFIGQIWIASAIANLVLYIPKHLSAIENKFWNKTSVRIVDEAKDIFLQYNFQFSIW